MNLRFESAINPYGCSPRVVAAMQQFAESKDYRFYGDPTAEGLRRQLAEHFDLAPENFMVYNGSGEALKDLFLLQLVMKKGALVAPYPSYERFVDGGKKFAREFIEVPLDSKTWALPLDRLIETTKAAGTALGMLSSPNNPTGNALLTEADLAALLEGTPQCLWVIDEAYADYRGGSFAGLVKRFQNLVILRTFSKAYGMAGLRVGYAITNPGISFIILQFRLPWAVNSMSLLAAETALADRDHLREIVQVINNDVKTFHDELVKFPSFKVYPTDANFFLIEVAGEKIKGLTEFLSQQNMTVRTRPDMPSHIRVTSLLPEDNRALLEAFKNFGL
jgi:histidinol-phosphate aminotransferase